MNSDWKTGIGGRLVLVGFLVFSACGGNVIAGNAVYLGRKEASPQSMDKLDHGIWDALLARYVDDDGRVNYQRWKESPDDIRRLDAYLSHLSSASVRIAAKRESKLAFWINAYNAVTVRGILREYPTSSIRNHTPKLWGYHIWKDLQLYVGGQPFSLDQMEHKLLRKMSEPRIHFAIVCASIGCPRLLNRAYTSEKVNAQLEENAKDFFSRRKNFRFDEKEKRFYLSAILDWFGEDFGESQQARLRRIAPWLPTPAATAAANTGSVQVSYLDYDWNLNKQ